MRTLQDRVQVGHRLSAKAKRKVDFYNRSHRDREIDSFATVTLNLISHAAQAR